MEIAWSLVFFGLLGGAGAATQAYAGIGEFLDPTNKNRFKVVIAGLVLMIVGGVCAALHLHAPLHFMAVIPHLGSMSGISVEAILMFCVMACGVGMLVGIKKENAALSKGFGVASVIFAIAFGFMAGDSYLLESRKGWDTYFLPLSFLASCFSLGGFVAFVISEELAAQKILGIVTLISSALAAVFSLSYGMTVGYLVPDSMLYVGLAVAGGVIATVVAGLIAFKEKKTAFIWIGVVAAFACGLLIRMFMWDAGVGMFDAFDIALTERGLYMPVD